MGLYQYWTAYRQMRVIHNQHQQWHKEHPRGYQDCNTSQILIFWWVCQGERIFLYPAYYLGRDPF
jgi:hypothetical protein